MKKMTGNADRILTKALRLFSSRGYHATSVREICQAAGVTKPTLYHFFGSKEGVYRALVDGALEDFKERLTIALSRAGSAEERLKRMARLYFEGGQRNPDLMRFIFGVIHNNQRTSAPPTDFARFYEDVVRMVSRCVEEGVLRGELERGPDELRMLVLMGTLGEALCGYLIIGRPEITPALADRLVELVLQGWKRRADVSRRRRGKALGPGGRRRVPRRRPSSGSSG
ncbi:MAG: TetR/AcrR family transcriptional regulator [Acidobacteria bacterium]|nr:TetR/AcrR family transcriptional regulator [Acidobacteriota bacterium]